MGTLTHTQETAIKDAMMRAHPEVSEADFQKVVRWAEETVISHEVVEMIFAGVIDVDVQNGEIYFLDRAKERVN